MCTLNQTLLMLEKARTAWKVVGKYSRCSEWLPRNRAKLSNFNSGGTTFNYHDHTTVKSPGGPGIMAYLSRSIAEVAAFKSGAQTSYVPFSKKVINYEEAIVVELRIPAGALVYYGTDHGQNIIAASEVYVVGKIGHEPNAG